MATDQTPDLATYLSELEAQRAGLDLLIASIRGRLGLGPGVDGGAAGLGAPSMAGGSGMGRETPVGRIRTDEFFRMSLPDAIRRYLEIMKQPQSPTAIVAALRAGGVLTTSKNFYTTVWTAMKRLKASGDIVNTTKGWGLSEWYPNRSKGGEEKKGKAKGKQGGGKKSPSRPKAAKKVPPAPEKAAARKPDAYHAFISDYMKGGGRTLAQANQAYREHKKG